MLWACLIIRLPPDGRRRQEMKVDRQTPWENELRRRKKGCATIAVCRVTSQGIAQLFLLALNPQQESPVAKDNHQQEKTNLQPVRSWLWKTDLEQGVQLHPDNLVEGLVGHPHQDPSIQETII